MGVNVNNLSLAVSIWHVSRYRQALNSILFSSGHFLLPGNVDPGQ